MNDLRTAKIQSHRQNIRRYARLLATGISDLERQYLHKQIVEEQAELERWEREPAEFIATRAPAQSQGGQSHA